MMTLAGLHSISLAAAGERSVEGVLATIVDRLIARPGLALARVWLVGPTNTCRVCVARGDTSDETPRLHLSASAGRSSDGTPVWRRLDGEFHRFDIGEGRVGHIASDGAPLLLQRDESTELMTHPEWLVQEGIASFAGNALVVDGRRIGAVGVFSRRTLDDGDLVHLRLFAEQCAVAIANSRVFAELETANHRLAEHNAYLREEITSSLGTDGILGTSAVIRRALDQARLVAGTDSTVLLLGETGTGKELFAHEIHARGTRRMRPLIKVNCGSIPHELFESEFFGHVKGSFTGATKDRLGRFQLANQGTLFLDEVGEISLDLQPKLLRALEEGDFERVGDDKTLHVDVRVIAATNRDLLAEVKAGRFREDLYYRLAVFPIVIPPLRDRIEDIPILARYFAQRARRTVGRPAFELTEDDLQVLCAYTWPGNIRELANVIERAAILSDGSHVDIATILPATARPAAQAGIVTETAWRELEKQNLIAALRATRGRLAGPGGAAELLGTKPTTLSSRLRALGIDAKNV
jgi:transcriptional regulator with GAF, ATPase, and Fis domain